MGERCRWAALGATFALLVAACAATEAPRSTRAGQRASAASAVTTSTPVPDALANADIADSGEEPSRQPEPCANPHRTALTVLDPRTGDTRWTLDLGQQPATDALIDGTIAYVPLAWDRTHPPGILAIDLADRVELWRRPLDDQPQSMRIVGDALVTVDRDGVRSIDRDTGADRWTTSAEFQFRDVVIEADMAYAINAVAVHAIGLDTGQVVWQLPIVRPDELAVQGTLLAVAAGPRVIAVDTELRGILWDQEVNRVGANPIHISADRVIAELSRTAAPAGGVQALDRTTGTQRWRLDAIDDIRWTGPDQFVSSVVPEAGRTGQPFDIVAFSASTGEQQWTLPATGPASRAVIGAARGRAVVSDPHPAVAGVHRVRLVDTSDGRVLRETTTGAPLDDAVIELGAFMTLHRSSGGGELAFVDGSREVWNIAGIGALEQAPLLTPEGLMIVATTVDADCIGRQPREPAVTS